MASNRQTLTDWLYKDGLLCPDLASVADSLMVAFEGTSFEVGRLNLGIFIMHPEFAGLAFQRTDEDDELKIIEVHHSDLETPVYRKSPISLAVETREAKLWGTVDMPGSQHDFLRELSLEGYTGYGVVPLRGTHRRIHVLSVATKKEGGFSPEEWEDLLAFSLPFSLLVDTLGVYQLAEVLLRLYVGNQTGSRVLTGAVQRGQGEIIDAVVLICDMKNFTQTCSSLSEKQTIELLNQFLDRVCGPIEEGGGEILKFMGDAVLAIFSADSRPLQEACRLGLRATQKAMVRLSSSDITLSTGQVVPVGAGFGLHVGQFHYGNIGTSSRLDFTAIGDAVNLASRIEGMCRTLDVDILCSTRFAELAGIQGRDTGLHKLKGIKGSVRLIELQFQSGARGHDS
jgi:adenylate cyclase